ncbi:hypothetical protein [Rhodothermus marinus]|uniref:hypothetical protein n=1 Tax=Rhodothermus marinus TaxID=29549 RepID=UPI0006D26F2A|nr:hypothetical protein [Rhodothermus marinus]
MKPRSHAFGVSALLLMLSLALLSSGCQKENPVQVLPEDVAGTYDFTHFIFIPDAAAIAPANVLDTLVAANTNLRLTASGQFVLSYQFINGPESLIAGTFEVMSDASPCVLIRGPRHSSPRCCSTRRWCSTARTSKACWRPAFAKPWTWPPFRIGIGAYRRSKAPCGCGWCCA